MSRVSERILVLDGATTYGPEIIGGKGASIARMRALGLPVPPAFVIPIEECRRYHAGDGELDGPMWDAASPAWSVTRAAVWGIPRRRCSCRCGRARR
jgi:pyruvate,orthophosphate dikinase